MGRNMAVRTEDVGPMVRGVKIPYTVEQLGPCATTAEPKCPRACAPQHEKPIHHH